VTETEIRPEIETGSQPVIEKEFRPEIEKGSQSVIEKEFRLVIATSFLQGIATSFRQGIATPFQLVIGKVGRPLWGDNLPSQWEEERGEPEFGAESVGPSL
jgi:hypothetical protein